MNIKNALIAYFPSIFLTSKFQLGPVNLFSGCRHRQFSIVLELLHFFQRLATLPNPELRQTPIETFEHDAGLANFHAADIAAPEKKQETKTE